MTLEEAIEHAEEVSEDTDVCIKCREDHMQLTEWLKELKKFKIDNTPVKTIKKDYLSEDFELCGSCRALLNKRRYIDFYYCPCCGHKLEWSK